MLTIFVFLLLVAAVAVNLVGGKAGIGRYFGIGRPGSWLITFGLIATALALAGYAVHTRWDGILIDRENRISLSRLQLVLWTMLLVSALLTAGLSNAVKPTDPAPLRIRVPPRIWALLGLGAFTAVAAPAITDDRRRSHHPAVAAASRCGENGQATEASPTGRAPDAEQGGRPSIPDMVQSRQGLPRRPCFAGDVLVKSEPRDARWIDLITGDNQGAPYVDVSKLQQLAFTLMLISVYALSLRPKFDGEDSIHEFPDPDTGFLALLAISHTAYLADLQVGMT